MEEENTWDWEGIIHDRDPTNSESRRLAKEKLIENIEENGTIDEFWQMRWLQHVPSLLAVAMGITEQGKLSKMLTELSEVRDRQSHRIWRE